MLFRDGVMLLWPHRVWLRYNNALQQRREQKPAVLDETRQLSVSDIICCVARRLIRASKAPVGVIGSFWETSGDTSLTQHAPFLPVYARSGGISTRSMDLFIPLCLVFPTVNAPLSSETPRPLGFDGAQTWRRKTWSRSPILHLLYSQQKLLCGNLAVTPLR